MRKQFYYHLSNDAGISALVGSRIYPQLAPTEGAKPYIVFTFTGMTSSYEQTGRIPYRKDSIEIIIAGTTIASLEPIAQAVNDAMDIQSTNIGDPLGTQERINATTFLSEYDDFDLVDGSEDPVYTITQTYEINYQEA
jgi:hypothetical protein